VSQPSVEQMLLSQESRHLAASNSSAQMCSPGCDSSAQSATDLSASSPRSCSGNWSQTLSSTRKHPEPRKPRCRSWQKSINLMRWSKRSYRKRRWQAKHALTCLVLNALVRKDSPRTTHNTTP